jgi:hypothetical protein
MDPITSLTDKLRDWFDRTPKAQEAYRRLGADLDTVMNRVDAATNGLRERIAPIIDPAREPAPLDPASPASPPPAASPPPPTQDEKPA